MHSSIRYQEGSFSLTPPSNIGFEGIQFVSQDPTVAAMYGIGQQAIVDAKGNLTGYRPVTNDINYMSFKELTERSDRMNTLFRKSVDRQILGALAEGRDVGGYEKILATSSFQPFQFTKDLATRRDEAHLDVEDLKFEANERRKMKIKRDKKKRMALVSPPSTKRKLYPAFRANINKKAKR